MKHAAYIAIFILGLFCPLVAQAQSQYDKKGELGESGLAMVVKNGKVGFVDKDDKVVIPLIYDYESGRWYNDNYVSKWDNQPLIRVKRNGKYGMINREGTEVVPVMYDKITQPELYKLENVVRVKLNGKYGYVNGYNQTVVPIKYDALEEEFYNGHPAYAKLNGKYGFIDQNNNVVAPFKYDTTRGFGFHSTLAPVSINGKYGYIDLIGNVAIPLQYSFADNFDNGLAAVVKNGKVGFIDESGSVVLPFQYDVRWTDDGNGKHLSSDYYYAPYIPVSKGGLWGTVDKTGKTLIPCQYDGWSMRSTYYINMTKGDKNYYFDALGNLYPTKKDRNEQSTEKLAEQGFPRAQYDLGYQYYYGKDGRQKDYTEAFNWFSKSAAGGYERGQYYLGWQYQYGQGTAKNIEEAKKWYRASAAQGFIPAQKQLAKLEGGEVKKYPPTLKLLSGDPTTSSYNLKVGVKSDSKIESVAVVVNGVASRGVVPVSNDGYDMTINQTITLRDGTNNIDVTAANASGSVTAEYVLTLASQNLPVIVWSLPSNSDVTSSALTVNAKVKSDTKIVSSTVKVNGRSRGISAVVNDGADFSITRDVTLQEGQNTITVEVANAAGTTSESRTVNYVVKRDNPTPEPKPTPQPTPVTTQKRLALVIGNANYKSAKLPVLSNSVNDARDIAAKLRQFGFTVVEKEDLNQVDFNRAIADFGRQASAFDVALFYYAGHALESDGMNYLAPVDAQLKEKVDMEVECIRADNILSRLVAAECNTNIIVLDACREKFRGAGTRGLARMEAPNTYFMFSTSPGKEAMDGSDRNSPFTKAFLSTLDADASQPLELFAKQVARRTMKNTNNAQQPWVEGSLLGDFYFKQK